MQTPSRKIRYLATSITVGCFKIPIYIAEGLEASDDASGLFDPSTPAIYLDASLNSTQLQEVFLHEVVEAINFCAGLELDHSKIQTIGLLLTQALLPLLDAEELPLDNAAPIDNNDRDEMDDS
jgi:hypothetical protein